MAHRLKESASESARVYKRSRTNFESTGEVQVRTMPRTSLLLANQPHTDTEMPTADADYELVPRMFERLAIVVNPSFVNAATQSGVIGYNRPLNQRFADLRFYTINVAQFRTTISRLLTPYLRRKLYESETMTFAEADAEVAAIVPVITNACMAALYAKLRNIHTQYQQYNGRFTTRPSYTKDIELPLPIADAIQNFGVFTPTNMTTNVLCVPVYPEGILNEGRSTQNWSSHQYESYLPFLKLFGVPVKSVDTRLKSGTAWWTFYVLRNNDSFDYRCIFPPANYSDHACMLSAMFTRLNDDGEPIQIIQHLPDDHEYPCRMREIPDGYHLRAFAALCQAPCEEWSQYLPVSNRP